MLDGEQKTAGSELWSGHMRQQQQRQMMRSAWDWYGIVDMPENEPAGETRPMYAETPSRMQCTRLKRGFLAVDIPKAVIKTDSIGQMIK